MALDLERGHSHDFVQGRDALMNLEQTVGCKQMHSPVHAGIANLRSVASRLNQTATAIIDDQQFEQTDPTAVTGSPTGWAADGTVNAR